MIRTPRLGKSGRNIIFLGGNTPRRVNTPNIRVLELNISAEGTCRSLEFQNLEIFFDSVPSPHRRKQLSQIVLVNQHFIMARAREGRRQKITPYNLFILIFVALGSMSYGYTASIIGTTLGMLCNAIRYIRSNKSRSTNIHRIFRTWN